MKKLLTVAFLIFTTASFAQDKTFSNVLKFFTLKQVEKAQVEIDKLMADPQNQSKAEGWLWKARIYGEFYFDSASSIKYPGAGLLTFDAFKKYEALDPSYKMIASESWRVIDLIYVGGFNVGKKFFELAGSFNKLVEQKKDSLNLIQSGTKIPSEDKAQSIARITRDKDALVKKQQPFWDSAYTYFASAAYSGDVIVKNNLRKNGAKLDTLTTIYAGYSAQNAKKDADAVKYYTKLADNKVGGDDYKDVYTYMLVYFANKKDAESFNKYLAISKELYPKGDWDDYEVDFLNKAYTLAQKVELYDKEDASGKLTARKYLLFGQMFTEINKDDKAGMDDAKQDFYHKKAVDAFKKAYTKDNTIGIAAFNAGVILYNEFGNYDDKYRAGVRALQELNSNKPVEKDPKKKAAADAKFKEQVEALKKANGETEKAMIEVGDQSIEWLEKSFNTMKSMSPKDKTTITCLDRSVDYLANIFAYKRDRVRGKDLKAFDAFEAKYKLYDGLHGTFK